MSQKINPDKLDKRAKALRENLKKRKALAKTTKTATQSKKDTPDADTQG